MSAENLSNKIKNLNVSDLSLSISKRPDNGGIKGKKTHFNVNFYPIEIDYSKTVYQYDVEMKFIFTKRDNTVGEAKVKKQLKIAILKKALENQPRYLYNGDKMLYSIEQFNVLNFETLYEDEAKNVSKYEIVLSQTTTIDLNMMKEYMNNRTNEIPLTCMNFLNTVYRQNKLDTHVYEKKSMFNLSENGTPIGDGLVYYTGQYQSIKACQAGWLQNIDIESCIFYKPISLIDYLKELFKDIDLRKPMAKENLKKFEACIKGIFIETTHSDNQKKHRIKKLAESADEFTFDINSDENNNLPRQVTVSKYFEETYSKLIYPHLPCVLVEYEKKNICFPIEVCNSSSLLSEFGIIENSKIEKRMFRVKARILDPPSVVYNDNKPIAARNGQWKMMNKRLLNTVKLEKWVIIWMSSSSDPSSKLIRNKFNVGLKNVFEKNGISVLAPIVQVMDKKSVEEIFKLIDENCPNPQLVIFVIEDMNNNYENIKFNAEKKYGITTQCINYAKFSSQIDFSIDLKNTDNDFKLNQYLSNVALKINSKIGGINNKVDFSNLHLNLSLEPVVFMGADVTNLGAYSKKNSIASVVSSRDLHFTKYCVRLSEQQNANEKRESQEIILELEQMCYQLLNSFIQNNKGLKPKRIIFYRDGIDSGQFGKVLAHEIKSIKNACQKLGIDAKITMIIVQKRHHTRFFPINGQECNKSGNIPSGTVIDDQITNKNQFDFYLCSHQAIKGTAKPVHYIVIYDENEFDSDDIEYLTFDLCHLYANSTKSVSLPAPVYYAHLAAYRGRLYEKIEEDSEEEEQDEEVKDLVKSSLIQIHPNLEEKMFFI